MMGETANSTFGDISIDLLNSSEGGEKPRFKPGEFQESVDSVIKANKGYTHFNYGTSTDSAYGVVNSSIGFGPVKTDTIKPKEKSQ